MLTKDAILGADDLPRELVGVPEWGGEVYVRGLTGRELEPFEQAVTDARNAEGRVDVTGLKPLLVALCLCNEASEPLFTVDDVGALSAKHGGAVARLYNVALRLNGLHDDADKELRGN